MDLELQPKLPDSIRNLFDNAVYNLRLCYSIFVGSNMTATLTITIIFLL